ncbi:MAG: pitrilysin family protein [Burkholderiales bacterium]
MKRAFCRLSAPLLLALAGPVWSQVDIQHWDAQSGARVYFVESHALPILDVAVEFPAGGAYDPPEKAGLGKLTLAMLKAGSSRYSETEITRRIADSGAQLQDNFDLDRAGYRLRTLSSEAQRRAATETLADMLQSPRFEGEVFEREKARAIATAGEEETRPEHIAEQRLYELMYPAHPYGSTETPRTLASITRDDLERHYRNYYGSKRVVVTIVGDLRRDAARALAEELTSRLAAGADATLPASPTASAGKTLRVPHPATQSHILLGLPALAYGDPDYFALLVGNYILGGGGFVSRLMKEVRSKRGFAYSVYSYFYPYEREGPFLVGLQTRRDQAAEALARTRSVIADFISAGPANAELEAAKKNLVGGFPLRIDNNRKILSQVATIAFYRLPLDWLGRYQARVEGVTLSQVRGAFARRIDPDKLSIVIVGAPE